MRTRIHAASLASFLVIGLLTAPSARAIDISFEKDPSLPLVYLNVAVTTGAVTDPADHEGITNFTGEILLRGTKSRSKEEIDLALDQMGAKLEVETRAEALVLRGATLSSQLDPFLKLVSEIVTQPSFPEIEIRKLKSEIVSGLLDELGNDQRLASRFYEMFLFQGHPYSHPVLGTISDVRSLTRKDIVDHYDRLFRDKQLLVVGSGEADPSVIKTWAKQLAELRPGEKLFKGVPAPQPPQERRLLIVDKPDRTQTQIYGGQLGIRMTDARFFPLYVANHAFGGGSFSARLMKEIRVARGWSYGAYSFFRHGTEPRSWQFYLFPAAKDTPAALGYTLGMVEKLSKSGISDEEFKFAQTSLVNSAGFMYNTPRKRVENKLLEHTLNLPEGFMRSYGPQIQKVTLADVNSATEAYFHPDRLQVVVVGTASELKDKLQKAMGVGAAQVKVVPYTQESLR